MAWSYRRDVTLCALGSGFPGSDDGDGHVLALYAGRTGWCSELTALHPASGRRADASNPDMQPRGPDDRRTVRTSRPRAATTSRCGARTSSAPSSTATCPPPSSPGSSRGPHCTYGSTAAGTNRIGVIERCPDADTDRLTVLTPDGPKGADTPDVQFSIELPAAGAVLVALSDERAAVALPNPARLVIYDRAGLQVSQFPLDLPDSAINTAPAGAPADVTSDGAKRVLVGRGHHRRARRHARSRRVDPARHARAAGPLRHRAAGAGPAAAWPMSTRRAARPAHPARRAAGAHRPRPARRGGRDAAEQRAGELVALRPVD